MVNPSQHKSQNPPPSVIPGTLPPPGQFQPQFISHPLNESDPLKQVQSLVGHRPFLLIGEGSHRTHEFFSFQAQMATLAIKQGCRNIFLEVPQLWVSELTDIFKAGGDAQAIREHIRSNFYYTWSDSSMVELLITIGARNAQTPNDPVNVYGIDPQARGVERRLEELDVSILEPGLKAQIEGLKREWKQYADQETLYFSWLKKQGNEPTLDLSPVIKELRERANSCRTAAQGVLASLDLPQKAKRLISALIPHLDMFDKPGIGESIAYRDGFMANDILSTSRNTNRAGNAPLAVVLAHNNHVAFGPGGAENGYFVDGMGERLRSTLEKEYGADCCATICQASVEGEIALNQSEMVKWECDAYRSFQTSDPTIVTELQNNHDAAIMMHFFPTQGINQGTLTPITIASFGQKDPVDNGAHLSKVYPGSHMEILLVRRWTTAAQWEI